MPMEQQTLLSSEHLSLKISRKCLHLTQSSLPDYKDTGKEFGMKRRTRWTRYKVTSELAYKKN